MKIEIIPQMGKEDCGAACVSMILTNYFNKNISICEIRPIIKNTNEGTSFGDLKNGFEKMGILSNLFEVVKKTEAFLEMSVPIITQIITDDKLYHYVVITKITQKYVYYADPRKTKVIKEKITNFIEKWQNYILVINLEQTGITINTEEDLDSIRYKSLLRIIKWRYLFIAVLSLFIYIIGLLIASMYNTYFNVIIPFNLTDSITYVMCLYLFISFIKFLTVYGVNRIQNSVSKSIDIKLSTEFFSALFKKSAAALEYFGIGETLTTLSNVVSIRERFVTYIITLPLNLVWLGSSCFMLIRINLYLTLLLFSFIILLSVITIYANENYEKYSYQILNSNKSFNDKIIDIFSHVETIKNYKQEDNFILSGKIELLKNINHQNNLLNFNAKLNGIKQSILEIFNIILFTIGAIQIARKDFSLGILLMYNSMIGYALNPLMTLLNTQSVLTQGKAAQQLLFNLLTNRMIYFEDGHFPDVNENFCISFNRVSFNFSSRNKLIDNVCLHLSGMKSIAITGMNGSGKTTIGKLIARKYLPDTGEILFNDIPINSISENSFREHVLFVESEEEMFDSNIIENITLGREVSKKRLDAICNSIGLNDIVNNLEKGFLTEVGRLGVSLSLGQRQLIKIARALLEPKEIYIFDEITNGLDFTHKKTVMSFILKQPGLKIFITHDDDIVSLCDDEVKMEQLI